MTDLPECAGCGRKPPPPDSPEIPHRHTRRPPEWTKASYVDEHEYGFSSNICTDCVRNPAIRERVRAEDRLRPNSEMARRWFAYWGAILDRYAAEAERDGEKDPVIEEIDAAEARGEGMVLREDVEASAAELRAMIEADEAVEDEEED